jgi:predicted GNAT superfamily acetyltransferase
VCSGAPAGRTLLAWVPEDITAMRAHDAERAHAWRVAARNTLGEAVAEGYRATAMLRSGCYVLESPQSDHRSAAPVWTIGAPAEERGTVHR